MTFSRCIATKTAPISFYTAFFISCQRKHYILYEEPRKEYFCTVIKVLISEYIYVEQFYVVVIIKRTGREGKKLLTFILTFEYLMFLFPKFFILVYLPNVGSFKPHLSLDRSVVPRARGTISINVKCQISDSDV